MGTIKDFEDLAIWKMAREITNSIYKDFRECRDFGFRDQITRAGVSAMNNISEGFCRGGDAEFRNFLKISRGSTEEIKNMYYVAEDQEYVSMDTASGRRDKTQQLINCLSRMIKYLTDSNKK